MGADVFMTRAEGKTAKDAFNNAVEHAQYESGHGGYTGTIAEKRDFTMITVPSGSKPAEYADKLIGEGDRRVDDKWGPAGCIDLGPTPRGLREFLFFGWASS